MKLIIVETFDDKMLMVMIMIQHRFVCEKMCINIYYPLRTKNKFGKLDSMDPEQKNIIHFVVVV